METRLQTLSTIEEKLGLSLPKSYREFLLSYDRAKTIRSLPIGTDWKCATLQAEDWPAEFHQTLAKPLTIDGMHYIYASQLAGYCRGISASNLSVQVEGSDDVFPLSGLARGIAIASSNTDILFLHPEEDFSVWVFWMTTHTTTRLCNDFSEWLSASASQLPAPIEPSPNERDAFVGRWKPVASPTLSQKVVQATSTLVLKDTFESEEIDLFQNTLLGTWGIVSPNAEGCVGIQVSNEDGQYIYWVTESRNNEMLLRSPDSKDIIVYEKESV